LKVAEIRKEFAGEILIKKIPEKDKRLNKGKDMFKLQLPLLYPDGDWIGLYLTYDKRGGLKITDDGDTFFRIGYTPPHNEGAFTRSYPRITKILKINYIEENDGELSREYDAAELEKYKGNILSSDIWNFLQAIVEICAIYEEKARE